MSKQLKIDFPTPPAPKRPGPMQIWLSIPLHTRINLKQFLRLCPVRKWRLYDLKKTSSWSWHLKAALNADMRDLNHKRRGLRDAEEWANHCEKYRAHLKRQEEAKEKRRKYFRA